MRFIEEKTLAFRISEEFHTRIKIQLAKDKKTLKDYVIELIEKDLMLRESGFAKNKSIRMDDIIEMLHEYEKQIKK